MNKHVKNDYPHTLSVNKKLLWVKISLKTSYFVLNKKEKNHYTIEKISTNPHEKVCRH